MNRLPDHVLVQILQEAHGETAWPRMDQTRKTLSRGLVCRAWLDAAHAVGWARMRIAYPSLHEDDGRPDAEDLTRSLEKLNVVCSARPGRLRHLRRLVLAYWIDTYDEAVPDDFKMAVEHFVMLVGRSAPGLVALEVSAVELSKDACESLAKLRLRCLRISFGRDDPDLSGLLDAVLDGSTASTVQELDLGVFNEGRIGSALDILNARSLPGLSKLVLGSGRYAMSEREILPEATICSLDAPQLVALDTVPQAVEVFVRSGRLLMQIQELKIIDLTGKMRSIGFAALVSLRKLIYYHYYYNSDQARLSSLPVTLQALTLEFGNVSIVHDWLSTGDPSEGRRLRSITLEDYEIGYVDDEIADFRICCGHMGIELIVTEDSAL